MQRRSEDLLHPLVEHPLADARIHRGSHQAMATEWAIWISHEDEVYARQAVWEAFQLLERLEAELSRFNPNSDIARLNRLTPGEILPLGAEAFGCLQKARALFEASGGAFDVTAGGLKDHYRENDSLRGRIAGRLRASRQPVGMEHLHLEGETMRVWRDVGVEVDLGAIGKGYAVDRMVELLQEWGLSDFLVHGGASSVAARGHAPGHAGWPVTLRHPRDGGRVQAQFPLTEQALGASGIARGEHIIDPRRRRPARTPLAVWVAASSATEADGWSTAFMVMSGTAVRSCIGEKQVTRALILGRDGSLTALP